MRQYEITFIIDPVLPGDEVQQAAKAYEKLLVEEGATIVNVDNVGLKQLAYPINGKQSGVYKCIEFQSENGAVIPKIELAFRRDERIMRFLSIGLDKYAIKFNEDRRSGLIGGKKEKSTEEKPTEGKKEFVRGDDLTLIEGVGPKAAKLLKTAGINSYAKLSGSTPNEIKAILTKGGPAFTMLNPATWPDQSQLAAAGKWSELNEMKAKLDGGVLKSSEEE